MRLIQLRKGSITAALLLGLGGVAAAQGSQGAQGELGAQARPVLTSDEQVKSGEGISQRASSLAERLSQMLGQARREKDILRVNCLNRKLTEANATADTIKQRVNDLKSAAAGGDEGRRNHEFTVLSVLAQQLDRLDQEASQCVGQGIYEAGGSSQVVTTVAPGAPTLDATSVPAPPPAPPSLTVPPPLVTPEPMSPDD